MAELQAVAPDHEDGPLRLQDLSSRSKWRVFTGPPAVRPGTAARLAERLVWSVSPGEWTVLGERPDGEAVDLTHVRAMFRLTGPEAARCLARVCALDLGDDMFPSGAAARTLMAEVATELVREDVEGERSYLILPSRSYGVYMDSVLTEAGREFGLL